MSDDVTVEEFLTWLRGCGETGDTARIIEYWMKEYRKACYTQFPNWMGTSEVDQDYVDWVNDWRARNKGE